MQMNGGHSLQILGWMLFILCAACYIADNVRNGDWLSLTGSVLFLAACVVFVVPLIVKRYPK
jgi:hypothetical protein